MDMTRRQVSLALGAAAILGASGARAETTTLSVLYAYPDVFRPLMDDLAERFQRANPDIKISFRAPAPEYEEALRVVLRESVTGSQPDVTMQGLNRIRAVAERNVAAPLDPFIAVDTAFQSQGVPKEALAATTINGKIYGVPFAMSLPVAYYNADLVRRAGGDPANLPRTWDDIIDLGKRIEALDAQTNGIVYAWDQTGNWMWQSLVFEHGGSMLDPSEKAMASSAPAEASIDILGRIVSEAGMPYLAHNAARQQFAAGGLGIFLTSSAQLATIESMTQKRFPVVTAQFPSLMPGFSKLPTGGSAFVVTARDAAKAKAAWRFVAFMSGPEASAEMARRTGYLPPNTKANDLLSDFYAQNPNFRTAVAQIPYMTGWYAFPGANGLKITDVIKDRLESIMSGQRATEPRKVLAELCADVTALLSQG